MYSLAITRMLGTPTNSSEGSGAVLTRHAVYVTLAGSSLLLNGIFLAVLWNSWTIVKRKRITYYVANLALSDTLLGASTCGHFLMRINGSTGTPQSKMLVVISWTATLTSLLAVSLMAVERALLILKPHNWMQILPQRKICYLLLGNWLVTLPLAILMHFYTLTMRFFLLVLFYVPILVTSILYSIVYKGISEAVRYNNELGERVLADNERKASMFNRKVAAFVRLLTVVLLVTVLPSFLCLFTKTTCELFKIELNAIDTVTELSYYFYMLELSNFVLNPIIYIWRINLYRQAFWHLVGKG